jgi:hypothetical protein
LAINGSEFREREQPASIISMRFNTKVTKSPRERRELKDQERLEALTQSSSLIFRIRLLGALVNLVVKIRADSKEQTSAVARANA